MVSGLSAPKSKAYLLPPALATFISSMSLLLDGLSFHSPMKGSFDAGNAAAARQAANRQNRERLSMEISLLLQYGEKRILDEQEWKVTTSNGRIGLKKS